MPAQGPPVGSVPRFGRLFGHRILRFFRRQGQSLALMVYPLMLGPVERAVRSYVTPGMSLEAAGGATRFSVQGLDERGIVLLLAARGTPVRVSWYCLEGVDAYLRGQGWILVRRPRSSTTEPETLEEYLRGCGERAAADRVAALLHAAGVVHLDTGPPARVRLRPRPWRQAVDSYR